MTDREALEAQLLYRPHDWRTSCLLADMMEEAGEPWELVAWHRLHCYMQPFYSIGSRLQVTLVSANKVNNMCRLHLLRKYSKESSLRQRQCWWVEGSGWAGNASLLRCAQDLVARAVLIAQAGRVVDVPLL